jgi:hypothetical protein
MLLQELDEAARSVNPDMLAVLDQDVK